MILAAPASKGKPFAFDEVRQMLHLVSTSDIARQCGLTTSAVHDWRKNPTFPRPACTYGASRRPLFDPAQVEAWVRSHRPEYLSEEVGA